MMGQSIYQRTAEMTVTRMYDHAGLLVKDKNIFILVNNVKRNILRQDLKSPSLIRHHKLDDISRTDHIVGLDYLIIDTDVLSLYRQLDTVTGSIFHMCRQIFVDTHRDLTGRDVETVMLEHLLLLILICHLIPSPDRVDILYRILIEIKEFSVLLHQPTVI